MKLVLSRLAVVLAGGVGEKVAVAAAVVSAGNPGVAG